MGRRTKKQRGGEAGKLSSRRVEKRKDRKTDEQRDGRVKRSDIKLSVAVATFNEAENLERCLKSVAGIADEIVVVDGGSADKTVEIAKSYGARVEVRENPVMFHINKQRAIDLCRGKWVLQLDADEAVSEELADEIRQVVGIQNPEFSIQNKYKAKLFEKHQKLIEERDGKVGTGKGPVVAFFMPRRNWFLGKLLRYGGNYPDGVIRLFKKGKAWLPCKSVHEQYEVDGRVGWLSEDLLHYDSPTFKRYWRRNGRYAELYANELRKQGVRRGMGNWIKYSLIKPMTTFVNIYVRHKGILDGWRGLVWAVGSGLTWAKAWRKLIQSAK